MARLSSEERWASIGANATVTKRVYRSGAHRRVLQGGPMDIHPPEPHRYQTVLSVRRRGSGGFPSEE
jgi:hypothetical protein